MRSLLRFLGLLAAAGAFVAVVIDGTKSIADGALNLTPTGAIWFTVSPATLNLAQAAIERHVSPVLWNPVALSVLTTPFFVILMVLSALFFLLGRKPRPLIGYATRQ